MSIKSRKAAKPADKAAKPVSESAKKPDADTTEVKTATKTIIVQNTVLDKDGAVLGEPKKLTKLEIVPFATSPAHVSVGSKLKKSDDNYGSTEVSVSITMPCYKEEVVPVYEQVSRLVESLLSKEAEDAGLLGGDEAEEDEDTEAEEEETDEEDSEEDEDSEDEESESKEKVEEIDEDVIRAMNRSELVKFIKEYKLDIDIDPKEYKKTEDLQEAIVSLLSEDEDGEEGEDAEDESEDEDETESEDEDDDSEEDEDETESEDEDDDSEEDDEESEDEDEEEGGDEPYTEAELKGAKLSELKAIAKEWQLTVKVKKDAPEAVQKKAYIKAILAADA